MSDNYYRNVKNSYPWKEDMSMRIEAYSQIQQLYNASKPATKQTSTATGSSFRDKLNISSTGKDLQVAKDALSKTPDVRMDKVNELKAAIANGTYDVSGEDFADKLLEKFSQTLA
jgi:negative regulator of flagellin synthesis FlgM